MLKATLYFVNNTNEDDIVRIFDDDVHNDMYRVVFKAHDMVGLNEFHMNYRDLQDYISDMLKSTQNDTDPYEYVQVMTAIHPSIMYHTSELEKREVRWQIEDMVGVACRCTVFRRGLKRTVPLVVRRRQHAHP
jgi:hypothetical protein